MSENCNGPLSLRSRQGLPFRTSSVRNWTGAGGIQKTGAISKKRRLLSNSNGYVFTSVLPRTTAAIQHLDTEMFGKLRQIFARTSGDVASQESNLTSSGIISFYLSLANYAANGSELLAIRTGKCAVSAQTINSNLKVLSGPLINIISSHSVRFVFAVPRMKRTL